MAVSPGGLVAPPMRFKISRASAWPPPQGPRSLEIRRGRLQEGTRCYCSGSELPKIAPVKIASEKAEEWRPLEARNEPRRIRARAMPTTPFPFARSKGLSNLKVYYPRCNNPRNNAPQSNDTPPKRDTGIASEKDWGINLLDEHVNESGINESGNTWYRESGEEHGDNGYKCRWHKMGGQSPDGSSKWKETWWEKSDWTGYKELGAEKNGTNADGDAWWETWQEVLYQDEWRSSVSIP